MLNFESVHARGDAATAHYVTRRLTKFPNPHWLNSLSH